MRLPSIISDPLVNDTMFLCERVSFLPQDLPNIHPTLQE